MHPTKFGGDVHPKNSLLLDLETQPLDKELLTLHRWVPIPDGGQPPGSLLAVEHGKTVGTEAIDPGYEGWDQSVASWQLYRTCFNHASELLINQFVI
jgi:hypothetical protein